MSLTPVFLILASALIGKERVSAQGIAGTLASILGASALVLL